MIRAARGPDVPCDTPDSVEFPRGIFGVLLVVFYGVMVGVLGGGLLGGILHDIVTGGQPHPVPSGRIGPGGDTGAAIGLVLGLVGGIIVAGIRSLAGVFKHVTHGTRSEWAKRPRVQLVVRCGLGIVSVVLPAEQRQVWVADVAGSLASAEGNGEWTSYLLGQLVALPDHAWVFRWHRRRERVR